jgi:hypothetical protein
MLARNLAKLSDISTGFNDNFSSLQISVEGQIPLLEVFPG